jgi:predicted MPP superfamily phosphohydrolase
LLSFVQLLLFAGAALGNLGLLVACHNWCYGLALPRYSGKVIHVVHGLLILAGPIAFWCAFGFDVLAPFSHSPAWHHVIAGYLVLCWLIGFGLLPWITVRRWGRGEPAVVLAVRSRVVDMAKELDGVPIGRGQSRLPAALPGNEIFQVEFIERELALPRLPAAWDGLTILHVSDLHLNGVPDKAFFRRVMQLCAEPEPDLVCITGDIADSAFHQRWIIPTLGWLRWKVGAFAILGNHDYWYDPPFIRRRLEKLKVKYLGNSYQQIEVRGEPLVVVGNEYPWTKPHPDLRACPSGAFRLCLSHTPDNMAWARRAGIDLMLSGHVHGGQIRFPVIGSVLVPSRFGRRYDCGTFHEPPTVLHVSRGLGGEHPVRWGCRPEVTRLVLRRGGV